MILFEYSLDQQFHLPNTTSTLHDSLLWVHDICIFQCSHIQ